MKLTSFRHIGGVVCVVLLATIAIGCGKSEQPVQTASGAPPQMAPPQPGPDLSNKVGMAHVTSEPPAPPILSSQELAVSDTVRDQAQPGERLSQMRTAGGGEIFFTVAPAGIKAIHSSPEAIAAAKRPGTYPNIENRTPEVLFALFTMNSGPINPADNSIGRTYLNRPAWIVVYHDMPIVSSVPGGAGAAAVVGAGPQQGTSSVVPVEKEYRGTITYVIDDTSGNALMSLTGP
jgi:hypothetical protein